MNFFSKFQKYFSFLKLFESPSKNIHVYLYTYISKHDISSKRLPYVYASRITRLFSILLARWPRIKDRKSKTGSTFIETERERERERGRERGLIEVMLVGNVVGISVSLCRRVAPPTGIVRARVFRLDNRPTPPLPPSVSLQPSLPP